MFSIFLSKLHNMGLGNTINCLHLLEILDFDVFVNLHNKLKNQNYD